MSTKSEVTESIQARRGPRIVIAAILIALVLLYSLGVVGGWIEARSRIDAVHLILIGLTGILVIALVRPEMLDRLKRVKLSGFELEMLAQVREKQAEHDIQLDDIRMILPLLLPDNERKHLTNLETGKTRGYKGSHSLRTELRRLRSMHLLRMKNSRRVGELKDGESLDLADLMELSKTGKRWLTRVRELESESQD